MPKCRHHEICGLTDEADPAAGLCVLHSLQVDKDPVVFTDVLKVHQKTHGNRFAYMVFPMDANFSDPTLLARANLIEGTFTKKVDFSHATFYGDSSFFFTNFAAGADFSYATFARGAYFSHATFTKRADFLNATFREGADFSEAKFSEMLNLASVTFSAGAYFSRATFSGGLYCFNTTFAAGANFSEATFTEAQFNVSTFAGKAYFGRATFTKRADFVHTTFTEEADFFRTTFTEANFETAAFSAGVDFSESTFAAVADFPGATFSGNTRFLYTTFAAEANFRGSQFRGRTLFTGLEAAEEHQLCPLSTAATNFDFCDLVIESPESLSFRHMDFRACRFLNTDLRKIELTGVRWPQKGARQLVYDEIDSALRGVPYPWDQLERLYRELKQNYDDRRNYARAGDFHYGEKEMQRRNPATPWSLKVLLWLYWLVSGYGERFLRPLLCTLVLLIGATVAYIWWGLAPKAPPLSTMPETTAFLVMPGAVSRPAPLPIMQPNAWLSALHYSFRVMTLLKPEDLEPMGLAKVVQTLESLLGPLFLGLFALAVRQRLKH
jgi:uncharacterized protein YjbI with pentapeptide repeats